MKKLIIFIAILLLTSCTMAKTASETVNLRTSDNISIAGDFYKVDSDKGLILLHMLNRTRSDWKDFASFLQKAGYNSIAIDLRGHGQSDMNWKDFSADDFNSMTKDVAAAKQFLANKNITKIAIIGASIGANTALNYAAEDKAIGTLVLLSPGLDYGGVSTADTITKYNRSMFIIVSRDDPESYNDSNLLYNKAKGKRQLQVYEKAGHGTRMFAIEPDMSELIREWLDLQLK